MEAPRPAAETWLHWQDGAHSPAENMAADSALLAEAPRLGRPVLRTYAWDRQAVSLGYVQRHDAAPAGYAFVRRPTGGGVVFHDFDFTFSAVFPVGHWLTGLDRTTSYNWLNRALQAALVSLGFPAELAACEIPHTVERATMVCFTNPTRYDLLLEGRKIAGSAQRHTADGMLHQASLHFGGPLPRPREAFRLALLRGLATVMNVAATPFEPDEAFRHVWATLTEKYGSDAWNLMR